MAGTTSWREAIREAWPAHQKRVTVAFFGSLTLGLAPFYPHAHIWKQLVNIARGTLTEPLDVIDLIMHGAPWVALAGALVMLLVDASKRRGGEAERNRGETDVSAG